MIRDLRRGVRTQTGSLPHTPMRRIESLCVPRLVDPFESSTRESATESLVGILRSDRDSADQYLSVLVTEGTLPPFFRSRQC